MQINFYKSSVTGLFILDDKIVPAGSFSMNVQGGGSVQFYRPDGSLVFEQNILIEDVLDENGDPYASIEALITAVADFFVKAGVVPATPKLDFLLVDYWEESTTPLENGFKDAITICNYNHGIDGIPNYAMFKHDGNVWKYVYGTDIIEDVPTVITPISKTTIFIHPTTFERYLFNGTTMEVYDDVDGIVPKWLKYEALLSQSGEDAPVARVLNQDERDYLGDIAWEIDDLADGNISVYVQNLSLLTATCSSTNGEMPFEGRAILDPDGALFLKFNNFNPISVSIKQRVRGNPPKLISAETNIAGDRIILTFDKKMSRHNMLVFNELIDDNYSSMASLINIVDDYTIEILYVENTFVSGDNIPSLRFSGWSSNQGISIPIESLDHGLLQPSSIPVTNNVPEPPQLLDAYTNEDGDKVILVFDKEIVIDVDYWNYYQNNIDTVFSISNAGYDYINNPLNPMIINGTTIELILNNGDLMTILNNDVYIISYEANFIKSLDGGVLQQFYDFPITNN